MGIVSGACTLYIAQTPLGVLDNKLFAFLVPPFRAYEWSITPVPQHGDDAVIIQTEDLADGLVLPDDETGTQIAVRPLIAGRSEPPTFPPDEVWVIAPLAEGDLPEGVPDGVAFTLRPQSVGDDQFIGRSEVEDLSMRPKPIVLRPPDAEPAPFIAIPVNKVGGNQVRAGWVRR